MFFGFFFQTHLFVCLFSNLIQPTNLPSNQSPLQPTKPTPLTHQPTSPTSPPTHSTDQPTTLPNPQKGVELREIEGMEERLKGEVQTLQCNLSGLQDTQAKVVHPSVIPVVHSSVTHVVHPSVSLHLCTLLRIFCCTPLSPSPVVHLFPLLQLYTSFRFSSCTSFFVTAVTHACMLQLLC